jgi:hypothetical protein
MNLRTNLVNDTGVIYLRIHIELRMGGSFSIWALILVEASSSFVACEMADERGEM